MICWSLVLICWSLVLICWYEVVFSVRVARISLPLRASQSQRLRPTIVFLKVHPRESAPRVPPENQFLLGAAPETIMSITAGVSLATEEQRSIIRTALGEPKKLFQHLMPEQVIPAPFTRAPPHLSPPSSACSPGLFHHRGWWPSLAHLLSCTLEWLFHLGVHCQ